MYIQPGKLTPRSVPGTRQDQDATQAPPDLEAQISTPPSPTKEEEGEEKSMEGFFKEVAAIKARRVLGEFLGWAQRLLQHTALQPCGLAVTLGSVMQRPDAQGRCPLLPLPTRIPPLLPTHAVADGGDPPQPG